MVQRLELLLFFLLLLHSDENAERAEELPPSGPLTTVCSGLLIFLSFVLIFLTFPFSLFSIIKVIPVYERAVIFRLGRIKGGKEAGPGIFFIIPCIDNVIKVDTRVKTFDVPPQSVRDHV